MKIVFDTNVILSAFITQGLSHRVFDICIDKHHLFISPWILEEINKKLKNKFKVPNQELKRIKNFLLAAFSSLIPKGEIPKICRDKDDNNILHLAKFVKADLIVTGDKDLLVLEKHGNIKIINPRQYMEEYNKE